MDIFIARGVEGEFVRCGFTVQGLGIEKLQYDDVAIHPVGFTVPALPVLCRTPTAWQACRIWEYAVMRFVSQRWEPK